MQAILFAIALTVFGGKVQAQEEGLIPNECCPEASIAPDPENPDGDPTVHDAGNGRLLVTTYGSAVRVLPFPTMHTGLSGIAQLYVSQFRFDVSYTAWTGSSALLTANLPMPDMLASHLDAGAGAVQPRPGTMPGLYLYQTGGHFYLYGAPLESGANPQATGDFTNITDAGPSIYRNQLSGAELWHYTSASPPYVEVKHIDGSVAKFASFNPYNTTTSGTLWRIAEVRDPYDNVSTYSYSSSHQLTSIAFPSGLRMDFDYAPSWAWSGSSCLEISYRQIDVQLTGQTWGMVFSGAQGTAGGTHFGERLVRTYSPARKVLKDQATAGSPHSIASMSAATVNGQIVHLFSYDATNRIYREKQAVHTGTAFAQTISSPTEIQEQEILVVTYDSNGRAASRTRSVTGSGTTYSYTTSGVRTTDLPSGVTLKAIVATNDLGASRRYEYDPVSGRVYSILYTPSDDSYGRPRAHDSTNSGIGGVASTDVEPTRITIYRIFDNTCTCQKPIEVREIATRGSDSTRTTLFQYHPDSKMVSRRTVTSPATSGPSTAVWEYSYVQAKTTGQLWGAWLIDTETTPEATYTYSYSNWQNRADATNHGRIAGTVTRSVANVTIQNSLTGSGTTTTIAEVLHRNLSSNPGGYTYQGNVQGQPRVIIDGDGVGTFYGYTTEGWVSSVADHNGRVTRSYTRDSAGNATSITGNAGSTAHAAVTTITDQSASGLVYATSATANGVASVTETYYDRFGYLAVERHNNLDSSAAAPSRHGGSSTGARGWVESQWIYDHYLLAETYRDR
ncbi:MAG: hypothetical protein JNK49_04180, partial [Planctomycetes bacterium]|nr:hypothetical protein [Planctomycetota bacterium]